MHQRRVTPKKRHKTPALRRMSVESTSSAIGASVRNQFCLPSDLWDSSYGTPLPHKLMIRKVSGGSMAEHVVFFSLNPPNSLIDLQDFTSNQLTATTYINAEPNPFSATQPDTLRNDQPRSEVGMSSARSEYIAPGASLGNDMAASSSASMQYAMNYLQNEDNFKHLK